MERRRAVKTALAAASLLVLVAGHAAAGDEAVVLMYHRFGDDRHPSTNIRVEQLEAQLDYLSSNGYTVVPLADVVAAIRGGGELPDRALAITVDDAYRSVYSVGYPIFKARGLPFTVFVATDPVDGGQADFMTWDQMREMAESDPGNRKVLHRPLGLRAVIGLRGNMDGSHGVFFFAVFHGGLSIFRNPVDIGL